MTLKPRLSRSRACGRGQLLLRLARRRAAGGATGTPLFAATGQLQITVVDKDTGKPVAVPDAPGRAEERVQAGQLPFWHDHFVFPGKATLKLPIGNYRFTIERGLEYLDQRRHVRHPALRRRLEAGRTAAVHRHVGRRLVVGRFGRAASRPRHRAADGGRQPARGRTGDVAERPVGRPARCPSRRWPASTAIATAIGWPGFGCGRARSSCCFNCRRRENSRPPKPSIRRRSMCCWKPERKSDFWVDATRAFWWDLPMLIAAGQIDSIRSRRRRSLPRFGAGPSEAGGRPPRPRTAIAAHRAWPSTASKSTSNCSNAACGFRPLPAAARASRRTQSATNRVYVHVDGELSYEKWWQSLRARPGRGHQRPAAEALGAKASCPATCSSAEEGTKLELQPALTVSTREPISYLEIIKNGHVERACRSTTIEDRQAAADRLQPQWLVPDPGGGRPVQGVPLCDDRAVLRRDRRRAAD